MKDAQNPDGQPTSGGGCSANQQSTLLLISTDRLDGKLFNAIMDSSSCTDEDIKNYDDSLDDPMDEIEDEEDEEEQRRSTFALLVEMKPAAANRTYWEAAGPG